MIRRPVVLCASYGLALRALAQTPPPSHPDLPSAVRAAPAVPGQGAFLRYQQCIGEHHHEVDLSKAARQIVELRDDRAMMDRAFQGDPDRANTISERSSSR
jgi:hypothetical protein